MLKFGERKELKNLQKDAQELIELYDQAVQRGDISAQQADEELTQALGTGYREDIEQAQAVLEHDFKTKTKLSGGVFIGLLFAFLLIGPGITGFLVIDAPNSISVDQVFTQTTTFIPGIQANISGLRASGIYTGSGDIRLVHIDSTGTERVIQENLAPQTDNGTVILSAGSVSNSTNRTVIIDSECLDTCNMSAPGPHIIRIEVTQGEFNFDSISYTIPTEFNESQEPAQEETPTEPNTTQPETNQTAPEQNVTQPTNQTENVTQPTEPETQQPQQNTTAPEEENTTETPTQPTTPNTTQPETNTSEPQTPTTGSTAVGDTCTQNSDCSSGICKTNTFAGTQQQSYCVASQTQCVTDLGTQNVYDAQDTLNANTCYASATEALWIADQGRFEVQSDTGALMYADKYGNMAITGQVQEGQTSTQEGWTAANGDINLEKATGNLYVSGSMLEESSPTGAGRVVQNAGFETQILFKDNGDIMIRGLLLEQATLS